MVDIGDDPPQPSAVEHFALWLTQRGGPQEVEFEHLLAAHPQWRGELEELHASWCRLVTAGDPTADALPLDAAHPADDVPDARWREPPPDRYRIEGEIARGGMGAILRIWDTDLRRPLAMKVALADDAPSEGNSERAATSRLARFLEEARVTSQLDHPGIVPVHELGLDVDGRHYFTMKLVEGRDLRQVFELVFSAQEGWSETRALGVLGKVCEAMAYAHRKGIVHRDLKPANIMVGNFGEVYVMDWGLARVLRGADLHDLRLDPDAGQREAGSSDPAAATDGADLRTMDGVVLGTPAYMPPEQARGDVDQLSPRSDVYSIGAMLYHLLARRVPYSDPERSPVPREVLARVLAGPPAPLLTCNPTVPEELVAICERAMAREPAQRYADTLAFAEDLRAFLEHRVVAAYETGALAELRKWLLRNRALAAALLAAVLILVAALVVGSALLVRAREAAALADTKAEEAEAQRRLAAQRADDVLSLSAAEDLQDLIARADALWPAVPANVGPCEQWLADARALLEGRPADPERGTLARRGLADHRRKLAELASRALPPASSPSTAPAAALHFANVQDGWWYTQLDQLIRGLEALADPDTGLCSAGASPEHGWGVLRRLEVARTLEERSRTGPAAIALWQEAITSIADPAQCPKYSGLRIAPQLGLLPIGRDPRSGLWEFAHLPTGAPATVGPRGSVELREGDGLVFVLIPGGTFWMGAQATDPDAANYDIHAQRNESPVHEVALAPFFLSKFEITQDQWKRFTGANPSLYGPNTSFAGKRTTSLHPVEQVSWRMANTVLKRMDLLLPTEAQWERAARGGTATSWWVGPDQRDLQGAANLADGFAMRHGAPSVWPFEKWLDDGRPVHAPVGQYRPNAFGLHDVCGNVYEICRESFGTYGLPERGGDGERQGGTAKGSILRGGGYHNAAGNARSAFRTDVASTYFDFAMGVRPARRLAP